MHLGLHNMRGIRQAAATSGIRPRAAVGYAIRLAAISFAAFWCTVSIAMAESTYCRQDIRQEQFVCYFDTITTTTILMEGSAWDIGISRERLYDHVRLRFANDASFITYLGMLPNEYYDSNEASKNALREKHLGHLLIEVWTVGEKPPVAAHISFKLWSHHIDFANSEEIQSATLGIIRGDPTTWVEDALTRLVKGAATYFVTTRQGL